MIEREIRLGIMRLDFLRFSSGTIDTSLTAYLPSNKMVSVDFGNPCQKLRLQISVLAKKLRWVTIKRTGLSL
jgi:hypothetical protein